MGILRNIAENIDTKKLIVVGSILLLLVMIILLATSGQSKENVDTLPFEGSSQDYNIRARIVGGDELFRIVGGDKRYDSLSEDLFVFGRTAYPEYKSAREGVIGFSVESKIIEDGDSVTFSGTFGSSSNKVEVSLTLRENERLRSSITDTKTKLNIDKELPSNSLFNDYIAKLPQQYDGYYAEYSRTDGKVIIYLDEKLRSLGEKAMNEIEMFASDGSFDKDKVQIIFPQSTGI